MDPDLHLDLDHELDPDLDLDPDIFGNFWAERLDTWMNVGVDLLYIFYHKSNVDIHVGNVVLKSSTCQDRTR